jgi:ADP-heptose:LPS heptosyltransferase
MRVLLVRLDGVGDAAVCTPLIAALRAAGHVVGAALTTRNAGIFNPHAIVAEHVLERIPWPAHGSTPDSSARAAQTIAAQRYDAALIASEEPEAYALARAIPVRVGFTTGWTRPFKNLWVRRQLTRAVSRLQRPGAGEEHEVEVLYRLGSGLVAASRPPDDVPVLRGVLTGAAAPSRRDAPVVVQAGGKWAASGVAGDALRAIVASLEPRGVRVVAAPHEREATAAELGVAVESFAGLPEWIAALDASAAVVTTDTGAAHVAGMLGVPVVDVFPDRDFAAQTRRWRPWASPSRLVRASALRGGAAGAIIEAELNAF